LYVVFVLAGLAAMMEGFGISLLLPLLDAADVSISEGASQETNGVIAGLKILLDYLGIGLSMVKILLFIALVFLIRGLVTFASNAYQSHLKAQLMYEIKSMVFDLYNRMNYSYFSSYNTG
jgi:subfamily B ATP-binding cassette protein MsbA